MIHSANAASPTTTSLVSKINPSTYGQTVTFVATVTRSVPNGEAVTFYDGNTQIGTTKTSSGSATLFLSSLSVGNHSITATYGGDINFASSTSNPITQLVKPSGTGTTTSLISTPSTSTYGQAVTLTATVSGGAPNGDTVTFYDSYTPIGTVATFSGSASLIISSLSGGIHSITARYSGDPYLPPSTSNPITVTVRLTSTSTSLTTASSGQSVTLTATVTPKSGYIPNGEIVTFKEGPSTIGTAKTSSGSATLLTSSLSIGNHSITATYGGDMNFTLSTSPISIVTVTLTNTINQPSCLLGVNTTSGSPYYVAPQKIVIYYTVKRIGSCGISSAIGTLSLSSATTGVVYSSIPINLSNIINTPVTRIIYANSSYAPRGDNLAVLLLTSGSISNLSTTSFYVLQPANISITSIKVASNNNTAVGSPISITTGVLNGAFFDAYNASVNLRIISPNLSVYRIRQQIGTIHAFQNTTLSINPGLRGVPQVQGQYFIVENVSFYSNYYTPNVVYTSSILYSNTTTASYVTYSNKNSGYNASLGYPIPPPNLGPVIIKSFPFYTDLIGSNTPSNLNSLGLYDSANYPITLNLTVPSLKFGRLTISTNSLVLQPNQTGTVQLQFALYGNVINTYNGIGTYLIPINVSLSTNNSITNTQLYTILNINNRSSGPQVLSSTRLLNGNKNANVQLVISNPTNLTSYNLLLYTNLNSSITRSKDNIALNGQSANISSDSRTYALSWSINRLLGNSNALVGYNISNVIQPQYLLIPSTFLSSTRQSNLTAVSIFQISKPQITYPNTTVNINIVAVYTGINATTLTFTLTPSAGANVLNPQQSFKVTPNTAVDAKFTVQTGPYPGNEFFKLVTPGAFASQTQYISLNVQPKPSPIFTIYDYLNDPRTIFGALTLAIYVTSIVYGRISRIYKDRKLRARSTVKNINSLRSLAKGINVAILDEGTSKRTFVRHQNKDGSLGGFVEDSAVSGKDVIVASTAIIENDPIVSGGVKVLDNATVSNHAIIRSNVIISGSARIGDDAELYGNAKVYGNARIFGQSEVYDNAQIHGDAAIFGDARIFGEAEISGNAKIYGSAQISGDARIRGGKIHKGDIT